MTSMKKSIGPWARLGTYTGVRVDPYPFAFCVVYTLVLVLVRMLNLVYAYAHADLPPTQFFRPLVTSLDH